MLSCRLLRRAAAVPAVVRMASSSSSSSLPSSSRPFLPACQGHRETAMAASLAAARGLRNGGGKQMLLWNRVVLRKWFNIGAGSGDSDFSADERDMDREDTLDWKHKLSDEERILGGLGASTTGDEMNDIPYRFGRHRSAIFRTQYIDVRELRICVGTWNVGGRFPPSDLNIQEWLDMEEQADIYVIGFQEIVPLNVGNIFGAEDNRPVAVWEDIIRETLNRNFPDESKCHSDPPSPSRFNPSDCTISMEHDLLSNPDNDSDGELHPLIEQGNASNNRIEKGKDFSRISSTETSDHFHDSGYEKLGSDLEDLTNEKKLTKVLSHSERLGMIWPEQPLDMLAHRLQDSADSSTSAEDDLAHDAIIDSRVKRKRPEFVRIISKQMVGIFLSIWVRRSLRKHIQNLKLSTVGVGAMGYIGNKGSISVSMSIHQTPFCFVCCHLAAGEKDGDELKRNSNVEEILRRTVFNPDHVIGMPKRIHDHERIIWLGDLNYRINLSYERTHELISKQDWDGLFEKDQLKRELRKGCTFDGWVEGVISFPPTYKYEFDSENYVGDESKSGRRTPAWCDRILSYGKGIRLLSYKRGELTLSDHRPVTAVYAAEVEVFRHKELKRANSH